MCARNRWWVIVAAVGLLSGLAVWAQPATVKLVASDGMANDEFGLAVSLNGDFALVGTAGAGPGYEQGAAYIYGRNMGGLNAWAQVIKLIPSDYAAGMEFGQSVSLSGCTAVVGASGATVMEEERGAAYIFDCNNGGLGAWGQSAKIAASDGGPWEDFGHSVSIDGDTVVVSAISAGPGYDQGAAYVFERNLGGPGAWGQVTKLTAPGSSAYWEFGEQVSISGDRIAVGCSGAFSGYGAVYIFERNLGGANAWGLAKIIMAPAGLGQYLDFGKAVSLYGDSVLVGVPDASTAYVFDRNQGGVGAWGQVAVLTAAGSGSEYANSVSLWQDAALVGAGAADSYYGAAYLYSRNLGGPGAWGQAAKITAFDGVQYDSFGHSVALYGTTALLGAPDADINTKYNQGAAYIFTRSGYDRSFLDDKLRSEFCVNIHTGDYKWSILKGPGVGVYTGVANIINGGTKIYSKPGALNYLNCTYDPIRKRAYGYFYTPAGAYSALADSNTTNNPPGCY